MDKNTDDNKPDSVIEKEKFMVCKLMFDDKLN